MRSIRHDFAMVAVFVFCLTGCAGSFVGDPSHLYFGSDAAEVTIYRPSRIAGAVLKYPIELDGRLLVRLGPGDVIRFPVSPGRHSLRLQGSSFLQGLEMVEVAFNAKPDETIFFKTDSIVTMDPGPTWFLVRERAEEALRHLRESNYDEIPLP